MKKYSLHASVTLFLCLVCPIFLAVLCSVIESARISGAKAQSAQIEGIADFSVLAEFEKEVLDQYELFVLDGAYGSGIFHPGKVEDRLVSYLQKNADPGSGTLSALFFDPWQLELEKGTLVSYALLTDRQGEPFYQQAVDYMRACYGQAAFRSFLNYPDLLQEIEKNLQDYKEKKKENEEALQAVEDEKEQAQKDAEESGRTGLGNPFRGINPLREIARVRKKDTLTLVTGGKALSRSSLPLFSDLPSKGSGQSGKLSIPSRYGGAADDILFREYLLAMFPNYLDEPAQSEGCLRYQCEYLIGGKRDDRKNLKIVVNRLLLIREAMNYLYCASDPSMNTAAGSLSAAMTGFLGIPALTAATQHALLLAWAYGESLIDMRSLLEGGKVPLKKDSTNWILTIENLGHLSQLLSSGTVPGRTGLAYRDYLRLLLCGGILRRQKLLALDLIQENLRKKPGMAGFRAGNCIVGIQTSSVWRIEPVFFRITAVFTGIAGRSVTVKQNGGITYLPQ